MKRWQPNEIREEKAILSPSKGGESMAFAWLWTLAALAAAALVTAALLSSIRIRVRYSRSGRLDQLVVVVRALFGLVRMHTIVPSIAIRGWDIVYNQKYRTTAGTFGGRAEKKRRLSWRTIVRYRGVMQDLVTSAGELKRWTRRTLRKLECTRWRMDVTVGTGDAALTGVVSGLFWSVLGCAVAATGQFTKLRTHPHGSVKPVYSGEEFTLVWEADFRMSMGTALLCCMRLGTRALKLGKTLKAMRRWAAQPDHA